MKRNTMRKRALVLLIALGLMGAILTACGNDNNSTPSPQNPQNPQNTPSNGTESTPDVGDNVPTNNQGNENNNSSNTPDRQYTELDTSLFDPDRSLPSFRFIELSDNDINRYVNAYGDELSVMKNQYHLAVPLTLKGFFDEGLTYVDTDEHRLDIKDNDFRAQALQKGLLLKPTLEGTYKIVTENNFWTKPVLIIANLSESAETVGEALDKQHYFFFYEDLDGIFIEVVFDMGTGATKKDFTFADTYEQYNHLIEVFGHPSRVGRGSHDFLFYDYADTSIVFYVSPDADYKKIEALAFVPQGGLDEFVFYFGEAGGTPIVFD